MVEEKLLHLDIQISLKMY